jgi:hypothetical protein
MGSNDADTEPFYQSDGRRSKVTCKQCGEADDLRLALDPVDDALFVACPACEVEIIRADLTFANVGLTFSTPDLDRIDPELRPRVQEELDDG